MCWRKICGRQPKRRPLNHMHNVSRSLRSLFGKVSAIRAGNGFGERVEKVLSMFAELARSPNSFMTQSSRRRLSNANLVMPRQLQTLGAGERKYPNRMYARSMKLRVSTRLATRRPWPPLTNQSPKPQFAKPNTIFSSRPRNCSIVPVRHMLRLLGCLITCSSLSLMVIRNPIPLLFSPLGIRDVMCTS